MPKPIDAHPIKGYERTIFGLQQREKNAEQSSNRVMNGYSVFAASIG